MIGAGDKCVKPYKRCLVAALLMLSSAYLLGQHHGTRGTNTPPPTGPAESDDLKDFSRLIALQASPEQVEVFRQAVASIETAKKRVTEFQHPEGIAGSDYSRAKAVSDAADDVRLDSGRFLLSFSDAQKSGLKAAVRKVHKADTEIDKQGKVLNRGPSSSAVEKVSTSLDELEQTLSDISKAMGIPPRPDTH